MNFYCYCFFRQVFHLTEKRWIVWMPGTFKSPERLLFKSFSLLSKQLLFFKGKVPIESCCFSIFFLNPLMRCSELFTNYEHWATLLTSELRFWEDTPKINMSFIGFYFPAKRSARIWKESDFGTISGALKQADSVSYVQTKERDTNSDRIT